MTQQVSIHLQTAKEKYVSLQANGRYRRNRATHFAGVLSVQVATGWMDSRANERCITGIRHEPLADLQRSVLNSTNLVAAHSHASSYDATDQNRQDKTDDGHEPQSDRQW